MDPNCLQRLSADDKSPLADKELNAYSYDINTYNYFCDNISSSSVLTLNAPITTAADDTFATSFLIFEKNKV